MGKSYTNPSKWDKFCWRLKDRVGHYKHKAWKGTEWGCRKALFLGRNTSLDYIIKVEGKPYYSLDSDKLAEHMDTSYIRFHGQPRREYYMDQILRFIFLKWYQPLFTFKLWCRNKLEWYLFFKARELTWKTHHYIHKSGTSHIDGYFEYKVWGIKCARTFDLCSLDCLKHDAREWDFKKKKHKRILNYLDLSEYGGWGFPTLLVLKNKVMPNDIEKILNKWYTDQVEWKYRHWTWKGEKPKIIVDELKFMEDLCQSCYRDTNEDGHSDHCKEKA